MKDLWKFRNRRMNADSGKQALLKDRYKKRLSVDMPVPGSRKFQTKDHQLRNCECRKLNN
jgi:hypothetical protein